MRSLVVLAVVARVLAVEPTPEIRRAVTRALPILQRSAARFVAQRACVSCHHNILPILVLHRARDRGIAVDEAVLDAVEDKTFRALRGPGALDEAIRAATLNDPTPNDSFLLMAAHSAGIDAGLVPAMYALRLLGWQREGHWVTSDFRPPHSSSFFTATATAVRAIGLYLPEELRAARETSLRQARQWLVATRPVSAEDASFRLLGLVWAGAPAAEIEIARKDLLAAQLPNGGWAELPRYPADAYSTGEALFALQESGLTRSARSVQRGFRYLIASQAADGSWRVGTRMLSPAQVSPPYFSTGFPYGKDEYISYAAGCWAVMALLDTLPEMAPAGRVIAHETEPWIRTALFAPAEQLSAMLDAGLDPNRQTRNGTTLLMMSAPDAEKVRLLVKHGADVKVRTRTGEDALTIAAAYRGTAAAIVSLLNAGAEAQPPSGLRVRHSPLLFASMTGDLENVELLLSRGAVAD